MLLDRKTPPSFHTIEEVNILPLQTQKLTNGMPLHWLNAGSQPVLRLELVFNAGNIQEAKPNASFLTVKMLGEGTKKYTASEIMENIDSYGAFIDFHHGAERISISIYTLCKHLEKVLPLLVDLINESIFPPKALENIKNITVQSLKVNEEKNNYVAGKRFKEALFGKTHPYGKSLDTNYILAVQQSDLITHFQQFIYKQPFDVFLVGQVNATELELIDKYLGSLIIEKNPNAPNFIPQPNAPDDKYIHLPKEGSLQSSIRLGRTLFSRKHPDYFPFTVTNEIFGGYFGSRLMKNIREEKGFTYGIYSSLAMYHDIGMMVIGTDVKKEYTEQTLAEIKKEAQILQNELVSESELTIVKNYMLGSFAGSLNTPFDLGELFKTLYYNELSYDFYDEYIKTLKSISAEEIQMMAQKYLNIDEMLEVVVG
jgi:predicted Zn-dependent peptidase